MRQFINIMEASNRLRALAERTFATLPEGAFEDADDFLRVVSACDPTHSKYVEWLLRHFERDEFWVLRSDLRHQLERFEKGIGKGKVRPDINSYKSYRQFVEAMAAVTGKSEKGGISFKIGPGDPERSRMITLQVLYNGGVIGGFGIDFAQRERGVATCHSSLKDHMRGKGIGTRVYDWVEQYVGKMGLKLLPSPILSSYSYRFWCKRRPDIMHHWESQEPQFSIYKLPDPDLYNQMK